MMEIGLYENRQVTFKEEYRRSLLRSTSCERERVYRVENRNVLGDIKVNGVDSAEKCSTGPKSKVHSGMAIYNNS